MVEPKVQWTEIWRRFDPVCIGPYRLSSIWDDSKGAPVHYPNTAGEVEVWSLRNGHPLLEHTAYLTKGSSALHVVAREIAFLSNWPGRSKKPLQTAVPGTAKVIRSGKRWVRTGHAIFWIVAALSLVLTAWFIVWSLTVLFAARG